LKSLFFFRRHPRRFSIFSKSCYSPLAQHTYHLGTRSLVFFFCFFPSNQLLCGFPPISCMTKELCFFFFLFFSFFFVLLKNCGTYSLFLPCRFRIAFTTTVFRFFPSPLPLCLLQRFLTESFGLTPPQSRGLLTSNHSSPFLFLLYNPHPVPLDQSPGGRFFLLAPFFYFNLFLNLSLFSSRLVSHSLPISPAGRFAALELSFTMSPTLSQNLSFLLSTLPPLRRFLRLIRCRAPPPLFPPLGPDKL